MRGIFRAWSIQRTVIGALIMREIQLRWGRRNLGFGWMIFEPLIFAFPVLIMWHAIRGGASEHGMPLMPFLWSGYLPLLMFRHTTGHALHTLRASAPLLYHRMVTPLDIMIARFGLELAGNFTATAISFFVLYMLGEMPLPYDWSLFLVGFLYMAWWSVAVGMIVAAWSERTELVGHIWMPISYIYMPVSGFVYLAMWLPTTARELALTVMPSLHAYEMIRGGLFGNQIQVFYDTAYLSAILAVLTLFGLWLVRDVRAHVQLE